MKSSQGVVIQSVERALTILDLFSGSDSELGISEIAEKMHLNKSTVYGLVNTLALSGLIEQGDISKKYRLGIKLFVLGNLVGSRIDLREEAKPYCRKLAADYHCGAHLAVRSDYEMIYIDKVDPPSIAISFSYVGKRARMYCTGIGKAMLAFMQNDFVEDYLDNVPLEAVTPKTITDRTIFMRELAQIRACGYAVDDEEAEPGIKCVAAPIFGWNGSPTAAISCSGSAALMTPAFVDDVRQGYVHDRT